jgi:hypothetical protein
VAKETVTASWLQAHLICLAFGQAQLAISVVSKNLALRMTPNSSDSPQGSSDRAELVLPCIAATLGSTQRQPTPAAGR